MSAIVYVVVGTIPDAQKFARVLDVPRKAVVSSGQVANEILRGRSEHAVIVPPLGDRLIDLLPSKLFSAMQRVDLHNRIAAAGRAHAAPKNGA